MRIVVITSFVLVKTLFACHSQSLTSYCPNKPVWVSDADYRKGKRILGESYSQMRNAKNGIVSIDYWNYGVAYSLMGQPADSVLYFFELAKLTNEKDFCELTNAVYPDVTDVKNSSYYKLLGFRFELLIKDCALYKKSEPSSDDIERYAKDNHYDKHLLLMLDSMRKRDQMYRSPFVPDLQQPLDLRNQKQAEIILEMHGYPGRNLVGERFEAVAWLVIQHADLSFQEKYLSMVADAVKNSQLNEAPLKMLLDRVYLKKVGKQIFGSQFGIEFADERTISEVKKRYNIN